MADQIVEIPMWGVNTSLNVMVSLGIVLYKVMENPNIQDIAILGHGTWYLWESTNGAVYYFDLVFDITSKIHKKGFLLKHTCSKKIRSGIDFSRISIR